jgi:hypothetical protein
LVVCRYFSISPRYFFGASLHQVGYSYKRAAKAITPSGSISRKKHGNMITQPTRRLLSGHAIPLIWAGPDNRETPEQTAKALANLTYQHTLEMAAGVGQIAQPLPPGNACIEVNHAWVVVGQSHAPRYKRVCASVLDPLVQEQIGRFDTIATSLFFSTKIEFVKTSASLLVPGGVACFLLPLISKTKITGRLNLFFLI